MIKKVPFIFTILYLLACSTPLTSPQPHAYSKTDKARMLVEMANSALLEGDATGALQHLFQAEQEDDRLPELYHTKALSYFQKHDLQEAILAARKAVKIKRDYSEAQNTLGALLMEAGQEEEAISYLMMAAKDRLNREAYKAWTNLGILSFRKGEDQRSEFYFSQAIQESPLLSCVAYYYRGSLLEKKNLLHQAITDYRLATRKLCSKFGEAYLALGIAYQKSKQFDLAKRTFLEIQKQHPHTLLSEKALDQLRFLP